MSLNRTKTNPELGLKVHEHLVSLGVETPIKETDLSPKEKIDKIEQHFTEIMKTLGLDLKDDSLIETPKRVAKMMVNEIFWGLEYENFPKCTVIENKMGYDEMVIEKDITIHSACEHHFVSILGHAHIAYIPKDKVLGLSKLNRCAEYFARRPQVQERLTEQIHAALCFILETDDVAVILEGEHLCVSTRGVEDTSSTTITSKLSGKFRDDTKPHIRQEFMSLIKR